MFCRSERKRELKEQQRRSQAIDEIIAQDSARMRREVRMLLLGPGGSGKTTIKKQMKILYKGGYTDDERADFRPIIFRNIVEAAKLLVEATNELGIPFENFKNVELCDYIVDYTADGDAEKKLLETPFVEAVASLWSDPSTSKVLERSNKSWL
jgi:guanine nucleotide-binding protein G(i) subunit alpha